MKTKTLQLLGMVAIGFGLLAAQPLQAKDSAQLAAFKKTLAASTPIELSAKATELVSGANDQNREAVTADVIRAAVNVSVTATPSVVGAISRAYPAMAPKAAVTAAVLQRHQMSAIAKAAAAGAPSQAGKIVTAMIKEFPGKVIVLADAVSAGAPSASKDILASVSVAIPALQPSIQKVMANFGSSAGNVTVMAVLTQSYSMSVFADPTFSGAPDTTPVNSTTQFLTDGVQQSSTPITPSPGS
jgi:hypothetical protein